MTGFLLWDNEVKAYRLPDENAVSMNWDESCMPVLNEVKAAVDEEGWFPKLATMWTQESSYASSGLTDVRVEHLIFIKSLCK